jgi:hypothetical protein
MSDGCEEREEREKRLVEEAKKDRTDWIDRDLTNPWEPERQES